MLTKDELPPCPVATTAQLIGNKWKLLIIRDLLTGTKRFGELRKSLDGISQKVLTDNLRSLEDDGIIIRTVYAELHQIIQILIFHIHHSQCIFQILVQTNLIAYLSPTIHFYVLTVYINYIIAHNIYCCKLLQCYRVIFLKDNHKSRHKKLGLKISYYRKLKGLTQEELAEKIDKNAGFIGQVEAPNMNKAISLDTLFDIAETLNVPAYKFIDFDED